jgi:hypothetical protein
MYLLFCLAWIFTKTVFCDSCHFVDMGIIFSLRHKKSFVGFAENNKFLLTQMKYFFHAHSLKSLTFLYFYVNIKMDISFT